MSGFLKKEKKKKEKANHGGRPRHLILFFLFFTLVSMFFFNLIKINFLNTCVGCPIYPICRLINLNYNNLIYKKYDSLYINI